MPVRIYDIAKKHGIESKEVLVKAKELGIAAARVPSSTLDKITAEYLEEHLPALKAALAPPAAPIPAPVEAAPIIIIAHEAPQPAAPAPAAHPPQETPPAPPAPIVIEKPIAAPVEAALPKAVEIPAPVVQEPPAKPEIPVAPVHLPVTHVQPTPVEHPKTEIVVKPLEAVPSVVPAVAPVSVAPSAVEIAPIPAPILPPAAPVAVTPSVAPIPQAIKPPEPPIVVVSEPQAPPAPAPYVPKVGDKVGFIQLPVKPGPRVGDKVGSVKLPPRPGQPPPRPGQPPQRPGQGQAQAQGRGRFDHRDNRGPGQGQAQGQGRGAPFNPRGAAEKPAPSGPPKYVPPSTGEMITMKPPIIVRDLAEQLKRKPHQVIADLMGMGVFAVVNQSIDETVAQRICGKYGFRFEVEKRERGGGIVHAPKKIDLQIDDKIEDLKPRAPVVTIMGHVDHGKTSLLDVIRKTSVAAGEAGGITQHIGAYTISFPHPEDKKRVQQITFLDTPGHAAFSSMRARGANVTDVVVLVVAANDGVMPQTVEALNHAKAAKVPILVAVNKCDHPNANPMRVRQQLQDKGLVPDDWGGDTIFVDVSALTKQGIDKLLEMIILQADLLELKANPDRRAKGNVIESGLEPGGPTATVLVRKGTLKVGDILICGQYYGKVRALINEDGKRMKEAGPSYAVKVLGMNGVPEAGLEFSVLENEKTARDLAEKREDEQRLEGQESRAKVTIENLFDTFETSQNKSLRVVVKADTQGSVEAIVEALKKIETEKVQLEIIHSAVGTITESDVLLASASKAVILGFHTRIDGAVPDTAKREGVQIKLYAIIYELIDQVKEAMSGLLDPILKDVVLGSAEVRKVFNLSKGGSVAGCAVTVGRIVKGKVRIVRRKVVVFEGIAQSLRRFQDEVNEVRAGMECGIRIDGFNDFQMGDAIECYSIEKVAPKL